MARGKEKKDFVFKKDTSNNLHARQGHYNSATKTLDTNVDDIYNEDPTTHILSMVIPLFGLTKEHKADTNNFHGYGVWESHVEPAKPTEQKES